MVFKEKRSRHETDLEQNDVDQTQNLSVGPEIGVTTFTSTGLYSQNLLLFVP